MSQNKVKTRFAPSPTGDLHMGGARTALFCWLFAKHYQGRFILRIEDTDSLRSTKEAVDVILRSMEWLGLDFNEGPYYQTQRFDRYHEVAQQLLDCGQAYRCVCSRERLETLRKAQIKAKQKPRYDGRCREKNVASQKGLSVIRFKNPQEGPLIFCDDVWGEISVRNSELDDIVLIRSDGTPTYNFAAVVDDTDMGITHVIRGADHINNTPRQINILNALRANIPCYAHLPMILGHDGKKLSKRHGAASILDYRDTGYLPEAIMNFLGRLGWSYGDQEIFSSEELIQHFNLSRVSRSPACFDLNKLVWLNQHYMKALQPAVVADALSRQFQLKHVSHKKGPSLSSVISLLAGRTTTLNEMADQSRYFFEDQITYDEKAARKHLQKSILAGLLAVREKVLMLNDWTTENLHQVILSVAQSLDLKLGQLAQPIRVAMTGTTKSPSLDLILKHIGQERVLMRLDRAAQYIRERD